MSEWMLRAANADDLPSLAALLPRWELEAATFVDDDANDLLLLAFPLASPSVPPLGCIRIRRAIGLTQPRYWFHVGYRVHAAADLGMFRRERTLLLGNDHTGATELTAFAIDAQRLDAAQQEPLTRVLVAAALMLLQRDRRQQPAAAGALPRVIAALPGARDESGQAPFWQRLGRHFFPGDVDASTARYGSLWATHVAALLPRHPLVVSVLHADAQAAIGVVHPDSAPLRAALEHCGLRAGQHVDLHDGGAVFEAHPDAIDCARPLQRRILDVRAGFNPSTRVLIAASTQAAVWEVAGHTDDHAVAISAESAQHLRLENGTPVWCSNSCF